MTIAIVVAICVVVLIVGFLLPRTSWWVERGFKLPFGFGQRAGAKAPGKAGDVAQKPFSKSKEAIGKSGSKGREGRAKSPF